MYFIFIFIFYLPWHIQAIFTIGFFHTFLCCLCFIGGTKIKTKTTEKCIKIQIVTRRFRMRLYMYMPHILAFSSSLATLKFSIHNVFQTRMLLTIFDAECPYKLSYFEPLCLPAKMAAETAIRSIGKGLYQ